MEGPKERYEKLGLKESLSRIYLYPQACKELSFILRTAFFRSPKNLQSVLFDDTLAAFRLLPQVQTQTAVAAANILLQSAEASLPKQKRVLAMSEFKHAMVTYKRTFKTRKEGEGTAQLPPDVLLHIFSFLDLQSLVFASLVCRSWNMSAHENHLWQLQYTILFGNFNINPMNEVHQCCGLEKNAKFKCLQEHAVGGVSIDWRDALKRAYKGISPKKLTSSRGCCRQCSAVVWLSDLKSSGHHGLNCRNNQIKPISTQQIVEYILKDSLSFTSSSDSDSDSDEDVSVPKLWAYSKRFCKLSL